MYAGSLPNEQYLGFVHADEAQTTHRYQRETSKVKLAGGKRNSIEFLVILRDFKKQLTQTRGVGPLQKAKPMVLLSRQNNHCELSPSSYMLGFSG